MGTLLDRRATGKPRARFGAEYARYLTDRDDWCRFVRHHVAIGETVEKVRTVAERAVEGLEEYTPAAERERLILEALRLWRRAKLIGGRLVRKGERVRSGVTIKWPNGMRFAFD